MRNDTNITGKILLLLIGVIILILLLLRKGDQEKPMDEVNPKEVTELPKESVDRYEFAIDQTIRVLLKSTDYKNIYHENVILTSDDMFSVKIGELKKEIPAGSELSMNSLFSMYEELSGQDEGATVPEKAVFIPDTEDGKIKVLTLGRHQGTPAYRGNLEIRKMDEGYLIINELPIEEYLYSVVTSEMPSDYPAQALMAQAVCARSYATRQMLDPAYKEYDADVDDSSGYQVYNNVEESAEAIEAVKATSGKAVIYQGSIASTYYFSTSCGQTTNDEVWRNEEGIVEEKKPYLIAQHIGPKEDTIAAVKLIEDEELDFSRALTTEEGFASYILSVNESDYESTEPWYRWHMSFYPSQLIHIKERLAERFAVNKHLILSKDGDHFVSELPRELSNLSDIKILHRNEGGLIDEILLCFKDEEIKVLTEYNIRYILAAEGAVITKHNQEMSDCGQLLPSAYFTMELKRNESNDILEEIIINGGGFGHGVGMSQNGAKNMALMGMDYQDILSFFYEGTTIGVVYE